MLHPLRYATRTLIRSPGFTATAVLTLALGIGANLAVFSAIDAVLLKPLPLPHAERLVRVTQTQDGSTENAIAPVRLEDWNRLSSTFEAISGYYTEDVAEVSGNVPQNVRRAITAPRFLEVWGVAPELGRGFNAADREDGAAGVVLISDAFWRSRFGADPNVLGRTLRIGTGGSYSIIGVMPASFRFPDPAVELWHAAPARSAATEAALSRAGVTPRSLTWYYGIGRLKPGATLDHARADLAHVQSQLAAQYPRTDAKVGVRLEAFREFIVSDVRSTLWLLFGAVAVLTLIACTNLATLLLTRAAQRERETSVRVSLGASPWSVVAQILAETGVLAFAGAAAGLGIAGIATQVFRLIGGGLPRAEAVVVDWRVGVYALASVVAVTLLSGLFPAVRTVTRGAVSGLNAAHRGRVGGHHSMHWGLVGAQVALSVALLAGAGLLLKSLAELSRVNPGFDATRVLAFRMSGSYGETGDRDRLLQRIEGTLKGLDDMPGVEAAATSLVTPGVPFSFQQQYVPSSGSRDPDDALTAESRGVSASYFRTLEIPVLEGRLCRQRGAGDEYELMVNRRFADRYFAGRSVLGMQLAAPSGGAGSAAGRVVGIVGDARERGLDRAVAPTVYTCFSAGNPMPVFLVRVRGAGLDRVETMRARLKELEPLRAVYDIAPLTEKIGGAFVQNRLRTALLAAFALAALALACVGLYGTLSYVVGLRRREIGLRIALGAMQENIVRQFLRRALGVVVGASIVGVALALALGRVLSGLLYGVSPADPGTLLSVVGLVLLVAAAAAWWPARRAARVDPMSALREE